MTSTTKKLEGNKILGVSLSWRLRFALLAILLIAIGTVYITNQLLTARFTQSTLQRSQLRLALYLSLIHI